MDLSVVPYKGSEVAEEEAAVAVGEKNGSSGAGGMAAAGPRYRECLKNHAAGLGAQAFDGCGEFMPGGEPGSLEALMCAACGCHRNFHRKEECGGGDYVPYDHAVPCNHPLLIYNNTAGRSSSHFPFYRRPLPTVLPLPAPKAIRAVAFHQPSGVTAGVKGNRGSETAPPSFFVPELAREREPSKKRFRTKFTPEQKEEMQKFAEKVGWRIQRHDNDELQEFCSKVGVTRQVLKVWMHNNKGALSGGGGGGAARAEGPSKSDPAQAIRV